jgi:hypothetical protein
VGGRGLDLDFRQQAAERTSACCLFVRGKRAAEFPGRWSSLSESRRAYNVSSVNPKLEQGLRS